MEEIWSSDMMKGKEGGRVWVRGTQVQDCMFQALYLVNLYKNKPKQNKTAYSRARLGPWETYAKRKTKKLNKQNHTRLSSFGKSVSRLLGSSNTDPVGRGGGSERLQKTVYSYVDLMSLCKKVGEVTYD